MEYGERLSQFRPVCFDPGGLDMNILGGLLDMLGGAWIRIAIDRCSTISAA